MTLALSIFVGLVTMLSIELVARRKRAGFLVGLGAQVPWVILDIRTEAYGLLLLGAFLSVSYFRAWRRWGAL